MPNQTQISKKVSYWLRHNPADANTTADEFGWIKTTDILAALNAQHEEVTITQLISLSQSFDKIRWEFSEDHLFIRATHGHSIPVILNNSAPPPAILYHGTASDKIKEIIKSGLMPMQRQFVHLSSNKGIATNVGSRHGKPILIEIETPALADKGWSFYKTSDNVWLTTAIPANYLSFTPWEIASDDEKTIALNQLKRELNNKNKLYERLPYLELILRRYDRDDFLFVDNADQSVHQVHLTWNNNNISPQWPYSSHYGTFDKWLEEALIDDQNNWI